MHGRRLPVIIVLEKLQKKVLNELHIDLYEIVRMENEAHIAIFGRYIEVLLCLPFQSVRNPALIASPNTSLGVVSQTMEQSA